MVNIMSQLRLKKMLDDIAFDRLPQPGPPLSWSFHPALPCHKVFAKTYKQFTAQ